MDYAAQYLRMSTEDQPLSIDMQADAIAKYASERGFQVVRTYADEAKSGVRLTGRDAMQRLLDDVKTPNCPFSIVLVLDVSRWGRFQDPDEAAHHEFQCRKHGVRVIYVAESFGDSDTPLAGLLKQLKRTMASEFSRDLANKARAGQIKAVNLGFATGQLPCLGFRREAVSTAGKTRLLEAKERKPHKTDHVRWVLGPSEEVRVVKELFRDYSTGSRNIAQIVRDLAASGITSSYGKPITVMAIRMLLRNEIVTGKFVWGARGPRRAVTDIAPLRDSLRNPNMVPPIVDAATWSATQARICTSTLQHKPGASRSVVLEKLRSALQSLPNLGARGLAEHGLKVHDLRKHFGSRTAAYYEAQAESVLGPTALLSPQWIGKRFLADLGLLLRSVGCAVIVDVRRNGLWIDQRFVKVRVARQLSFWPDSPFHVHQLARAERAGRWLLVLRLNFGGMAGRDFFLLPPHVHECFNGWLGKKNEGEFASFRIADASTLAARLTSLSDADAQADLLLDTELRWSA